MSSGPVTVAQADFSTTDEATVVGAPGVGKAIYVSGFAGSNAGASLSTYTIKDGATTKYKYSCAASGGGFDKSFPVKAWKLTDNTALKVVQSAAVVGSFSVEYEVR